MKQVINTPNAPQAIGPYSQGVQAGQFLFISGQLPINAQTGQLVQNCIEDETKTVLENIEAIVKKAGAGLSDIVKTTIYLKDLKNFDRVNATYQKFFQADPPARACVEVSGLPKGVNVEIEAIAIIS